MSPGWVMVNWSGGTRESEQPINMICGVWLLLAKFLKKSGSTSNCQGQFNPNPIKMNKMQHLVSTNGHHNKMTKAFSHFHIFSHTKQNDYHTTHTFLLTNSLLPSNNLWYVSSYFFWADSVPFSFSWLWLWLWWVQVGEHLLLLSWLDCNGHDLHWEKERREAVLFLRKSEDLLAVAVERNWRDRYMLIFINRFVCDSIFYWACVRCFANGSVRVCLQLKVPVSDGERAGIFACAHGIPGISGGDTEMSRCFADTNSSLNNSKWLRSKVTPVTDLLNIYSRSDLWWRNFVSAQQWTNQVTLTNSKE